MKEIEKKIIEKYKESNSSRASIIRDFKIKESILYQTLKKFNIPVKHAKINQNLEQQVVDLYTNGKLNSTEISTMLNIEKSIIINVLKRNDIEMLGRKKPKQIEEDVIALYKTLTITEVAKKMSITRDTVARILKRYNVDIRPLKTSSENESHIVEYYINNIVSLREVSIIFDLSSQTILNILNRNFIKIRSNIQVRLRLSDAEYEQYINILPEIEKYRNKVISTTRKQPLHLLENFEKRGKPGQEGAYNVDHKFSIVEGFKNNISPVIIGDIVNLEMLPFKENISKNSKCSITLNELYKSYENKKS